MKNISVFCGSSSGFDPIFMQQASLLGQCVAQRGYGVVYGGASVGLMGAVANSAMQAGGKVIGVIPEFLKKKEIEFDGLSEIHVVDTMHERKALMHELSDAVIALPGGYGTLDELYEILTWAQLALHKKPIGLLNVKGYYTPLVEMTAKMQDNGFLRNDYQNLLIVEDDISRLLDKLEMFEPVENDNWFEAIS
ncbi:TIGR00730 family Rossman fold protein [Dysgonomonas sp. 511]|uniref:LOG family protein n=1 Tax=Dysgonomonas sp. 511 TaxID=2302930 RepID=UPI0013D50970|nr:TIGR00730 family Rossman fold protein [Dysgonomonas sp. 511]